MDDDELVSVSWGRLLKRTFGTVIIAFNGSEGLEAYKANKIDIVVTDITMPVMNGLDMAQAIQEYDKNSKIIFMTGHNERENMEKMALLGGISLIKPVDMEEFVSTVLSVL